MADKKFAQGLRVDKPTENTKHFIVAKLGFKVDDFVKFLDENKSVAGWTNVDILISKEKGSYYAVLNEYKPDTSNVPKSIANTSIKAPQDSTEDAGEDKEIDYSQIPF